MEKRTLSLLPTTQASTTTSQPRRHSTWLLLGLFATLALLITPTPAPLLKATSFVQNKLNYQTYHHYTHQQYSSLSIAKAAAAFHSVKAGCGQAEPILPNPDVYNLSSTLDAKDRIIKWHQGIIQVPTQSYDDMGPPGVDPRWDIFAELHAYLEKAYPLVYKNLKVTKVNTWSLVFEWFGSDDSLRPIFITGHQDVVPVLPATIYQWTHDPFSGEYDGTYIWGRGASDDKSTVTAILAGIELLLEAGFKPTRTVLLAFGQDEEIGGNYGAKELSKWVEAKYGKDSMAILVDEGSGLSSSWGRTFGLPAVAEKGTTNINMTVSTLGGHSSVPPKHTNIGLTALLIAQLEKNPLPVSLEKFSPVWGFLQCAAGYAPGIPKTLKDKVLKSESGDAKAFKSLPDELIEVGIGAEWGGPGNGNFAEALMSTTQATDIIYGGVKVNALPEVVTTIINYRIDVGSSRKELYSTIFQTLLPVAKELNLSLVGYGFEYTGGSKGTVYLSDPGMSAALDPAPISPFTVDNAAWRLLAGSARGIYASRKEVSKDGSLVQLAEEDELIMSPFMSTGNTDTNRYWDLTRNIYRWRYFPDDAKEGIHTINERVSADAMVEFTRWFQSFILIADVATDL